MFLVELLANSAVACSCYIVLNMPSILAFHISHITWGIILQLIIADNVLTSYIKFCYAYVKFKRANQSCSPSKIRESINGKWRTCDRNGKQFFEWKQEKLWSFHEARNVLIEKNSRFRYISKLFRGAKEQESE